MSMKQTSRQGIVALSIVIVLGGVLVALATTVTYLSIGEAQSGFAHFKGNENLSFVEGCVEDAMLKIRSDSSYAGGTIGRPGTEGTCSITIISKTGSPTVTWTVNATITSTAYKRTIQVVFNRASTGITLTSWKEI